MKSKSYFKIFFFFSFALIFVYFSYRFVVKFNSELDDIRIVHWEYIPAIIILLFLTSFLNGLTSKFLLRDLKLNLKFQDWYGLTIINTLLNYIVPFRGGTLTVASYLKTRYEFSVSNFVTALSASYIVIFWVNSLSALLGLAWLYFYRQVFSITLFVFFLSTLIFITIILVFSPQLKIRENKYINRIITVINSWHSMRKNWKLQLKVFFISILNIFVSAGIIFFQFKVLGFEINYPNAILLSVIASFSLLLSFTPSSIGVREAMMVFTGFALGIPVIQTILVGVLDRIIGFTFVLLLSPYFLKKLGFVKNPANWLKRLLS